MSDEHEGQRGFRVTDRRRFAEEGVTPPAATREAGRPPPEPDVPPAASPVAAGEPVTFVTFVLGLSTQALVHLGDVEDPSTRTRAQDLAAAKQVIDLLGILRDKTRSNLDQNEEALLDSILYDLRMRYVELARSGV